MDRSEAATTLLRWQFEGERDLVAAAGRLASDSLIAVVERLSRPRPSPRRPRVPPEPFLEALKLPEEREAEALRSRLRALAGWIPIDRYYDLESRLAPGLLPRRRLAAIRKDLVRAGMREERARLDREFKALVTSPKPQGLLALLLFSRDGRLIASEGDVSGLELPALSGLVRRADPGSSWNLAHHQGHLVGHAGGRTALVAVLAGRPGPSVGPTMRASVASLERREKLLNAPDTPANHDKLRAYVRTVRLLLLRERGITPRLRA